MPHNFDIFDSITVLLLWVMLLAAVFAVLGWLADFLQRRFNRDS